MLYILRILITIIVLLISFLICSTLNFNNINKKRIYLYSLISVFPFIINQECSFSRGFEKNLLQDCFNYFNFFAVILPFLFYFSIRYIKENFIKKETSYYSIYISTPAAFFSLILILGESYSKAGNWEYALDPLSGALIKTSLVFTGWYTILYFAIAVLYTGLNALPSRQILPAPPKKGIFKLLRTYLAALARRPFRISFVTLACFYLPLLILVYPGNLCPDNHSQIIKGFTEIAFFFPNSSDACLDNHHPLVHTMLIHACISAGIYLFHSPTFGLYLFTILQFVFTIAVFSLTIRVGISIARLRPETAAILVLVCCLHPRIEGLIFHLSKNSLYAPAFIGFILSLYLLLKAPQKNISILLTSIGILFFSITMAALRNEGQYVVLASILITLYFSRLGRKIALFILPAFLSFCYFQSGLLPHILHAGKANGLDTFCLPIQQIARCCTLGYEPSSAENRKLLHSLFDVKKLASSYDPLLADPAKAASRFTINDGKNVALMRLWTAYLQEYPGTCLQATLHHHYETLYPVQQYISCIPSNADKSNFALTNQYTKPIGVVFQPTTSFFRYFNIFERVRENLFLRNPIGIIIANTSSYVWCITLLIFYALTARKAMALCLLAPYFFTVCMLFLGPCSGTIYIYSAPFYYSLPLLLPFIINLIHTPSKA